MQERVVGRDDRDAEAQAMQRLLGTVPTPPLSGLWSRPNFLAMGDEPCPVTDEKRLAGWLQMAC